MNNKLIQLLSVLIIAVISVPSYSALIDVTSQKSVFRTTTGTTTTTTLGNFAAIIDPPFSVNDDAYTNTAQQGFDEKQNVTLSRNLAADNNVTLTSGSIVSSHMIFLNSVSDSTDDFLGHQNVIWTFDAVILGVMSDINASFEVASSYLSSSPDTTKLLGSDTTTYPFFSSNGRGLEISTGSFDSYEIISPNSIKVSMGVIEPGDWMRVVTAAKVPEPSSILLLLVGLLTLRFKFKRQLNV